MLSRCEFGQFTAVFPLEHVWLYLTDRCNLACAHCFYRYKTQKRSMTADLRSGILEFLSGETDYSFVISGGEPLSDWEGVCDLADRVRARGRQDTLSVQSNLLLLNKARADLLVRQGVSVELGIDGDAQTTQMSRPLPGGGEYHPRLLKALEVWRSCGGRLTATMTVTPASAGRMAKNLEYLDSLGLDTVEVHPAFLEDWSGAAAGEFLRGYRAIWAYALKKRRPHLIGTGYSRPARGSWDLLVMPDGSVVPSWVWLSVPDRSRTAGCLLKFSRGRARWLPPAAAYFRKLRSFLMAARRRGAVPTYRQLSNFNALLLRPFLPVRHRGRVDEYEQLCRSVARLDRMMSRADGVRFKD